MRASERNDFVRFNRPLRQLTHRTDFNAFHEVKVDRFEGLLGYLALVAKSSPVTV